ncbi:cupin-like domain-containing protein [Xylaria longipes]|nr:cupin-like domain-containing protein [Xylaria longipes]
MLSHFEKLKTPLKSVFEYPHLEAQDKRFSRLGWPQVEAVSLWQVWTNDKWISASKRQEMDLIEPFDEWEEFALFASHYCVVIARNFALENGSADSDVVAKYQPQPPSPELLFHAYSGTHGKRRFGATLQTRDKLGELVFANTFGLGTNTRLKSCDLYSIESSTLGISMGSVGPSSRVCHAIADLGHFGSLLVGGRASPTTALRDCWHFSMEQNRWSLTNDLPVPLYRHGVAQLGRSKMAILIGGKSDSSTVFPGCLIHRPGSGWIECSISGSAYRPVFGAMLVSFRKHHLTNDISGSLAVHFEGILAGGLLEDGTVTHQLLRWSLKLPADGNPTISFKPIETSTDTELLICRFGASALLLGDERIIVVGGVQHNGIVPRGDEVLVIDTLDPKLRIISRCPMASSNNPFGVPRPLLVGTSVSLADHQLLVMGGGATCFSMGTYWNEGCYALNIGSLLDDSPPTTSRGPLRFQKSVEVVDQSQSAKSAYESVPRPQRATISDIPRIRVSTENSFEKILRTGKPVIIEGSDLGTCVQRWTGAYLTENVGPQRKVVVHEASRSMMDFNSKNFSYTTKDFTSFMEEVEKGGNQYLRALSEEHPSDQPANIEVDFPGLASDFKLPPEISFVKRNEHSSVLRVSGRVHMWLHYDVMANVYCQIAGSKKLLLFPPDDVSQLSFAPGASSSSIDVFSGLETPALALTHPHEATLGPGDILFIPPLWLHATAPLTDLGVAVNVFFRNLETGYSSGRDVYGNRDIAAYEKGRMDVARITNSFTRLPRDVQAFYMRRLADEMTENILR